MLLGKSYVGTWTLGKNYFNWLKVLAGAGGADVNQRIQDKLDKLEELKRKQEELEAEIDEIKRDIGHALVEEDVTIKTSYVSKRLIQGNITHRFVVVCSADWSRVTKMTLDIALIYGSVFRENVHIMVLPVAETIEKQLMVVLRDRQEDLTDFLGLVLFTLCYTGTYLGHVTALISWSQ